MKALVACRGGIFLTEGKIGVLSVSSLFFHAGEGVCGCMCVYTHTHTHNAQMGYSVVSPGVGMRHLEGPKNPDGKFQHICIRICVSSTHVYVYARRRDEILD